jgi:hypothetical protein
MYRGLTAAYRTIARELGTRLIQVGDAFHRADTDPTWRYRPDRKFDFKDAQRPALPDQTHFDFKDAQRPALPDQTHSLHVGWQWMRPASGTPPLRMDGHHANGAGQYLGACVFYEVLFGESVVGHAFVPRGMDAAYARFLQETAHCAVAESRAKPPPANPSSGDDAPCDVSAAIISDFVPPVPR